MNGGNGNGMLQCIRARLRRKHGKADGDAARAKETAAH